MISDDDDDRNTTELEIEKRTWNKLEAAMKLFGFREGAVEGKNLTLQEGFNLGYLNGFELGEYIGMAKGVINCEAELQLPSDKKLQLKEETINQLSSQPCTVCLEEKKSQESSGYNLVYEKVEELTLAQQVHSNKIINSLKISDLDRYFEKR